MFCTSPQLNVCLDNVCLQELHAGYVEDNLLAQVRAACVDQEIDVWVLGRTRIRFRVGKLVGYTLQ